LRKGGDGNDTRKRATATIQWDEKGELPNYTETICEVCVWNDSSTVEGRVSKQ